MSEFLSPLQHDALCEIFNISVGQSAAAMSGLVGEEVSLSVPTMRFCALSALNSRAGVDQWRRVDVVRQHFRGSFEGEALLMFPNDDGVELARMLVAGVGDTKIAFEALSGDAMAEIGNIILNACLSALADLMGEEFEYELPMLSSGSVMEVLLQRTGDLEHPVLFLQIQFLLESHRLEGFMAFVMDVVSLDALRMGVDRFLGHLGAPNSEP
ncbi:chemotaxis protein CheX [Chitinimonas sp.]|uniref:chemotaxis protein CheX n=1 Tax=Chitinimonas sp. TaxID=1934313 RepID=UPI0035B1F945